ncbi:hypothetical protein [Chondrinema litorale]|uniref:hypothetical protein n=1 Tax=Chondrinema litorale TaxID=2994555 RepID=UPI00254367F5|nr:hypothetical protein [Chondrinema litorale]UZR98850.1 hypothetical protein OQ292_33195 [Chondrinema litorale]
MKQILIDKPTSRKSMIYSTELYFNLIYMLIMFLVILLLPYKLDYYIGHYPYAFIICLGLLISFWLIYLIKIMRFNLNRITLENNAIQLDLWNFKTSKSILIPLNNLTIKVNQSRSGSSLHFYNHNKKIVTQNEKHGGWKHFELLDLYVQLKKLKGENP